MSKPVRRSPVRSCLIDGEGIGVLDAGRGRARRGTQAVAVAAS
jgi:hypothetical protein